MRLQTARSKVISLLALVVWLSFTLSACGGIEEAHTPEETLALAASSLAGMDDYGFNVKTELSLGDAGNVYRSESYEGQVTGHHQLSVRLEKGLRPLAELSDEQQARYRNPAARLAELEKLGKTVSYVRGSDPGTIQLHIQLEPDSARNELEKQVFQQFETAARQIDPSIDADASDAKEMEGANAMNAALQQEVERSRMKLREMLDTASIESELTVSIERARLLPLRMQETSVLRYRYNGRDFTERRATNVSFGGFDGRP